MAQKIRFLWLIGILALTSLALLGCSSLARRNSVAVYPPATPALRPLPPVSNANRAYMELVVPDTDAAAQEAVRLAARYDGYLTSFNTWETQGRRLAALEIAVPSRSYPALRASLLGLGRLVSESTAWLDGGPPPWSQPADMALISLQLSQDLPRLTPLDPGAPRWDPGRTLRRAWGVFVAIFGFIADGVIWVVVVAGPFLLVGGLAVWLVRRNRGKSAP